MNAYHLTVNGARYVVKADDHLAGWKASVARAAQHGGGFIDITNTDGVRTALLITPYSTVTVHEFDQAHVEAHSRVFDVAAFDEY